MARFLNAEHHQFQEVFHRYVQNKIVPNMPKWEEERGVPRTAWKDMGAQGYLCPCAPAEFGGGDADFAYAYIINHELGRTGYTLGFGLHSDIIVPYISHYGTPEQKERWLPGCVSGDIITAIAMTEPGTGSDLQAIATTAVKDEHGYVINGSKTFISNGICNDLVIVVCRTDPHASGVKALSLIVVEDGTAGFVKARKLDKMGLHSQDTAELFFQDCRVPASNLLGEENQAFKYLMARLQEERLIVSIEAQAIGERILEVALDYARLRTAFGKPIGSFQHNQFKLAEMATEVALGRTFIDDLVQDHIDGKDIITKVSMAKWWVAEMVNRIAYHAVQLHGGYGYMEEYEIARLYRDVRMRTIAAGTTEIMKQTIAKRIGL